MRISHTPTFARLLVLGALALLLVSCVHSPYEAPVPAGLRPPNGLTADCPIQPADGSIWIPNQSGSLFTDTTARHLYDIVFVNVTEDANATQTAKTDLERESTVDYGIRNLLGQENEWDTINDTDPTSGVDPAHLVRANTQNDFTGDGETNRRGRLTARVSAQVVEVFPNGNMRLYGSQVVAVNGENQLITLEGIVRPEDLQSDNSVDSYLLAEARIEFNGRGTLADLQRPGWGARALAWVWPF